VGNTNEIEKIMSKPKPKPTKGGIIDDAVYDLWTELRLRDLLKQYEEDAKK
jgi:hypothetical protein